MALHSIGILTNPTKTWRAVGDEDVGVPRRFVHTIVFALIPAICWYYGVSQVGWSIGIEGVQKLTPESAAYICALFYLAMLGGVLFLGYMIHWMAQTYAADSTWAKGVAIITYTATPFFVSGLLGLYPSLWLGLLVGLVVVAYCVYLLYVGIPLVMKISAERGFLFASAIIGVSLVSLVALMGATVILWDFGIEPVYTY